MTYQQKPWDLERHEQICEVDEDLSRFVAIWGDDDLTAPALVRQLISYYAVTLHGARPPGGIREQLLADVVAHVNEQIDWSVAARAEVGK